MNELSNNMVSSQRRHRTTCFSHLLASVLLMGMLLGCRQADDGNSVHVLRPVDDPLILPYRFQLEHSHVGLKPMTMFPVDFDNNGTLESYELQNARSPVQNLSSILLYNCLYCETVIDQYNFEGARITDTYTSDLDGDGYTEIIVVFANPDTLFAEIIHPKKGRVFRTVLSTGTDLNGDGVWDVSGWVRESVDLTGDEVPELLVAIDVDYDLYTRELVCLDWTTGKRVWSYEVSGIILANTSLVQYDPQSGQRRIVFGVASKGNSTVADGMDDRHSYLICLDVQGRLVWRRETGDIYTSPSPAFVHYDKDTVPEILFVSSRAPDSTEREGSVGRERAWSIVACDLAGASVDSLPMTTGRRLLNLRGFDPGPRGQPVFTFETGDDTVRFYSAQLNPRQFITYSARIRVRDFHDFLGIGMPQALVSTPDGKLWLLDSDWEPLAQLSENILPNSYEVMPVDVSAHETKLLVNTHQNNETYFFRLVRTPWYTVFHRHPLLAVAAGVTPFAAILAVIGVAMVRGRRKNRIISKQKDELAQALADLRAAQARLVETEKLQLTHDIAGGVAHEIRNALDPAVQCLSALQAEMPTSDDRFSSMLDLSSRSVSRALRMTRMVKELSDLAGAVQPETIPVRPVIDRILERFQARLGALDIDVTIDTPEDLTIACTRDHADVLFGNLIGNAIDALAGSEDRRLYVSGSVSDGNAVIRVADSGGGVPPDDRERIFNAFYSTKPSTGMGLGLTLCTRIAAIYRGSLALDPGTENGAAFVVTLPVGQSGGAV